MVSVVIPTWNRVRFVREAISSVTAQSFADWELIVVDDGSTDETLETLGKLQDLRIRLIATPHSGSAATARNRGIEAARGKWIAFLDSDDLWTPEKLQVQLDALAQAGAGWCYCDYCLIDEQGKDDPLARSGFRPFNGRIIEQLLLEQTAACINTLLIRRDLVEQVGRFDETLAYYEDMDFELRLAAAADAVAVDKPLVRVRRHPARRTDAMERAHEHALLVHERLLSRRPRPPVARLAKAAMARHLFSGGKNRIRAGDLWTGIQMLGRALWLSLSG
jgi:glycosyltransferase involved in cell wall biosynthesis